MMKKLGLALLVAASTASPVSAGAGWGWSFLNACGGNEFSTCMSGNIVYNGAGVITVNVTNGSPYAGDVFTAVGLFNLPNGSLPTSYTSTMPAFSPNNGINGGGLPGPNSRRYSIGSNGIGGGFGEAAGQQTFTFTFAPSRWTSISNAANSIGVGVHVQGGPRGCSTKLGVQAGGVVQNQDREAYAECTSVPEPGSMALLATGIAGLAFVGARRRKGLDLVDEDGNEVV